LLLEPDELKTSDTERGGAGVQKKRSRWIRLALTFIAAIALSYGLTYGIQKGLSASNLPINSLDWLAYVTVFFTSTLANLSVIVPVPLALSIMIAAATEWNPLIIAVVGGVGGSIGELSGYYVGYLGKRIAVLDDISLYQRIRRWIFRYGVLTIFVLALQPVIPVDIGGFVAGTVRMPMRKFFPALMVGKILKYSVLTYAAAGLIHSLPSCFH
jgi:membrane protein YqaA with SNARE-associated domain